MTNKTNKRWRKPKVKSRIDNPETLASEHTKHRTKKNKTINTIHHRKLKR